MWMNEILLRKYTNAFRKKIVLKTKEDKVIRNTFRTRQGQQEYTTWKNWWNIVPMFHCIFPKKTPKNVVLEFRISDVMTFLWISLQLNDLRNITTTLKNLNPHLLFRSVHSFPLLLLQLTKNITSLLFALQSRFQVYSLFFCVC